MPAPEQDSHGIGQLINEINEEYQRQYNTTDVIFNQGATDITVAIENETSGGDGPVKRYRTNFGDHAVFDKEFTAGSYTVSDTGFDLISDQGSVRLYLDPDAQATHVPHWGNPETFRAGVKAGSNTGDGWHYIGRGWHVQNFNGRGGYGIQWGDMADGTTGVWAVVHNGNTTTTTKTPMAVDHNPAAPYQIEATVDPAAGETTFAVDESPQSDFGSYDTVTIADTPQGGAPEKYWSVEVGNIVDGTPMDFEVQEIEWEHGPVA